MALIPSSTTIRLPASPSAISFGIDIELHLRPSYATMSGSNQSTDRPTDIPVIESTEAAAARLGVSKNAILQRIKRGTLMGQKIDGIWWVVVDPQFAESGNDRPADRPTDRTSPRPTDRPTDQAIVTLTAGIEQRYNETIQTLREGYEIQLRAQHEAFIGWLGEKDVVIAAKDETIAAIQSEREELRRRAETAESRLSELEAQQVESPDEPASVAETRPQRAWWAFWRD